MPRLAGFSQESANSTPSIFDYHFFFRIEQARARDERVARLLAANLEIALKLAATVETGQRLETELAASKAVIASHEQIFQKLTAVSQVVVDGRNGPTLRNGETERLDVPAATSPGT